MKRLVIACVIAFAVTGCARFFDTAERLCIAEARAHATYMLVIAPRRTAAQVEKAITFHGKVQKACAEGGTLDHIRAAIAAAEAARN